MEDRQITTIKTDSEENIQCFNNFLSKAVDIKSKIHESVNILKIDSFKTEEQGDFDMINSIKEIISTVQPNSSYFTDNAIFKDDFYKARSTINSALDCYLNCLMKLSNPQILPEEKTKLINAIINDIKDLSPLLSTFSSILQEISNSIPSTTDPEYPEKLAYLNKRLGIECALFNFCVKINETDKFPFFKSNYVQIYKYYKTINEISSNIAPISSFSGTGKTSCLPLILFCRNLKDQNNSPFILMTTTDPSQAESKKSFFDSLISKYVNIETDTKKLIQIFNDFNGCTKGQKLTLGLLTPYNLLPLTHELNDCKTFLKHARLIIDDAHQKSIHNTVIVSRICDLNENNDLSLALNVVLLSSSFPAEIINKICSTGNSNNNNVQLTELANKSQYEITENEFIFEKVDKIEFKIPNMLSKVLFRMAKTKFKEKVEQETNQKDETNSNVDDKHESATPNDDDKNESKTKQNTNANKDKKSKKKADSNVEDKHESATPNDDDENESKTKQSTNANKDKKSKNKADSIVEDKHESATPNDDNDDDDANKNETKTKQSTNANKNRKYNKKTNSKFNDKRKNANSNDDNDDDDKNELKTKQITEIEEGHILCFLPNTRVCNYISKNIVKYVKDSDIVILQTSPKRFESVEKFYEQLEEEYEFYEQKQKEFIYFVPLAISGLSDKITNHVVKKSFQGKLKSVNKIIFATSYLETFHIDDLSVVIDSRLVKEEIFNHKNGLTSSVEKLASNASKLIRKGRLGRTMKGLYISFEPFKPKDKEGGKQKVYKKRDKQDTNTKEAKVEDSKEAKVADLKEDKVEDAKEAKVEDAKGEKKIADCETPSIQNRDLTKNYLLMKQINISLDKLTNLPYEPNQANLNYSINKLKRIGAIDKETLEITKFGHEILRFDFLPIDYMSSIVKYSRILDHGDNTITENDKNLYYFTSAYISLLVTMNRLVIREDESEMLSNFYEEDSDIVTLFGATIYHLKNENKLKQCFSFDKFERHLQEVVDFKFKGKEIIDVINEMIIFADEKGGISKIIDDFIDHFDDDWKQIHSIRFQVIRQTKTNKSPELVFLGDDRLKFDKKQADGKLFLYKRPGWLGLTVPSRCYCFNIDFSTDDKTYKKYTGYLIHRQLPCTTSITSIECKSIAILNPWFKVLLKSYLNSRIPFFISTLGSKVFISFKSDDSSDLKEQIENGINICLDIFPFTPRSILVYKSGIDVITEIKSVGANRYEPINSTSCRGKILDKDSIDYCYSIIDDLSSTNSPFRICCLFVNETCKYSELDQNNLYIIGPTFDSNLLDVVHSKTKETQLKNIKSNEAVNAGKYGYFRFSPVFIHQSLFEFDDTIESVMRWFHDYCSFVDVKEVKGNKFRMKLSEILQLQIYIHNNYNKIKKQLDLKSIAVPFPNEIKDKIIENNEKWIINKKYNTIIAKKEDENEVNDFIEKFKTKEINKKNIPSYFLHAKISPILCLNDCCQPELTDLPITILFANNQAYSTRICKQCIYDRVHFVSQTLYTDGKINKEALESINAKPYSLTYLQSREYNNGAKIFPQIALGQLIMVIFNFNDDELSSILSAHLHSIVEFSIRYRMKKIFTFCPVHRSNILKVDPDFDEIKCNINGCSNVYCRHCYCMHDTENKCLMELDKDHQHCPVCFQIFKKGSGCHILNCICGSKFCYKCGVIVENKSDEASHMHFDEDQED